MLQKRCVPNSKPLNGCLFSLHGGKNVQFYICVKSNRNDVMLLVSVTQDITQQNRILTETC